jgi:hypothetical protein
VHDLVYVPPSARAVVPRERIRALDLAPIGALAAVIAAGVLGPAALALVALGLATGAVVHASREVRQDPIARPIEPEVMPIAIDAPELRGAYLRLLTTYETVRHSLARAPEARGAVEHLFVQARDLVHRAGRLALGANPLHRYLELHAAAHLEAEIHALEDRVAVTADGEAAVAYGHALAARRRQLEARRSVEKLCDRIAARLEMATATLAMFGAVAVEIGGAQLAQVSSDADTIADQASALADDLGVLEAELGVAHGRGEV